MPGATQPFARRLLTAVGRFIGAINAVVVPVTHPDARDAALGDGTLELVGGTGHLRCRGRGRIRRGSGQAGLCQPLPHKNHPTVQSPTDALGIKAKHPGLLGDHVHRRDGEKCLLMAPKGSTAPRDRAAAGR